jgi:hypothetical protein
MLARVIKASALSSPPLIPSVSQSLEVHAVTTADSRENEDIKLKLVRQSGCCFSVRQLSMLPAAATVTSATAADHEPAPPPKQQLAAVFTQLAQQHPATTSASGKHIPAGPRLPLASVVPALRAAGVRLQVEDAKDVEAAAAPFAPLTQAHFIHFAHQAWGRHAHGETAAVKKNKTKGTV